MSRLDRIDLPEDPPPMLPYPPLPEGVSALRPGMSPLLLCDRLITLAEDADRAGLKRAASRLVTLAYAVCDIH